MRTLRTASALLAIFAAACTSGDPVGPAATDRHPPAYENRTAGPGTATPPDRPSHGGSLIGSGY